MTICPMLFRGDSSQDVVRLFALISFKDNEYS